MKRGGAGDRAGLKFAFVKIGLAVGALMFTLLLGEVIARVYYRAAYGVSLFGNIRRDHEFGWEGRRVFGDPQTRRFRLLVVGDSMTNGAGVPDADLYSSVLGRRLDVEVFTYGGGGYGTLQEYLVVNHYLPIVRPDLVVLQVSYNDLINNSLELERASYFNNNFAIRPYLEGDRIRYHSPSRLARAASRSRLTYWCVMNGSRVAATLATKGLLHSVEIDMEQGLTFEPLRRAAATTETLVAKLKARLGPVPLVAFAADHARYWPGILQHQHVPFFDGVPSAIENTERVLGASVRPDGAHWDVRGHRVVGEVLAPWIAEMQSAVRAGTTPTR
jgi:lysophospholipase L1-like esterase